MATTMSLDMDIFTFYILFGYLDFNFLFIVKINWWNKIYGLWDQDCHPQGPTLLMWLCRQCHSSSVTISNDTAKLKQQSTTTTIILFLDLLLIACQLNEININSLLELYYHPKIPHCTWYWQHVSSGVCTDNDSAEFKSNTQQSTIVLLPITPEAYIIHRE